VKHCSKNPTQPDCLTEFRKQHPDADWDKDFRGEGWECYKKVRETLRRDQLGLCAYCEIGLRPNDEQVAHFHPKKDKSGKHNWALDWGNLWLACKGGSGIRRSDRRKQGLEHADVDSCDQAKGEKVLDGVILSPAAVPVSPRLFRYRFREQEKRASIEVDEARCNEAGVDIGLVEGTIAELNLNCRRLAEARFAVYLELEEQKQMLRESSDLEAARAGIRRLAAQYLDPDSQGRRLAFFTLIRERLGRAAEEHLEAIGYGG
jgi:uncharacterized protein (TIGR02646 family)